jgi:ATP-dependent Clp protease ATP-binding subunit ClpA
LFLTTNRVGHFDDAFISRIHVVIRYDNLKHEDRKRIWEQFFDKLTDERDDFIITRRAKTYVLEDDVISKMEWNGREIRNGMTSFNSTTYHTQGANALF